MPTGSFPVDSALSINHSEAMDSGRSLTGAVEQFAPDTDRYLSACTLGLPTRETLAVLRAHLDDWTVGRVDTAQVSRVVEEVRGHFATMVGVPVGGVTIGSQVSPFVGLVAQSLPVGAEVLCVDGDFSSTVFPFLSRPDLKVRHVAPERLADEVTSTTRLVSFSVVQSATGAVADVEAIVGACAQHDTLTLADATQAVGWLPVDASRFDACVCHTYKWLCAPRGVTLASVGERLAEMPTTLSGWYGGDDPWRACYGPEMPLAPDARRFDLSPAWPAWIGAAPALRQFAELDPRETRAHALACANAFRDRMGMPAGDSAIVTWPDPDGAALARLTAGGFTASGRAGRARVSFHLWNTPEGAVRAAAQASAVD